MAISSQPRRRSGLREIRHDASFPDNAVSYCLRAAGLSTDRSRCGCLLREAIHQGRAPPGNLSWHRPSRAPVLRCSDSHVAQRESQHRPGNPQGDGQGAQSTRPLHRAPRIARRQCLLSRRRSMKRRFSRWMASASGPRPRSGPATDTRFASTKRSTSRIRSGCSTAPSRITPASRSTRASTRSWDSPRTASPSTRR